MLKNRLMPVLALLLVLVSTTAQAFFAPPYITPSSPIAGQTISVNVYGGVCDSILYMPGYPQISQTGNAIRILFFGVRYTDPILCNIGVGTATFPVAAYPSGAYTLQVDLRYFDMNGDITVDTLGVVPFTVSPAPPVAAPTLDKVGLGVLVLVLLGCVGLTTRKRGTSLLLFACLSFNAHSQPPPPPNHTIEVLLTTAKGAPTAQQLVDDYARSRDGPPPLQAFAAVPPAQVSCLLPRRAQGDFLARLQANPDSVRAKLERYVLVQYPDTTDLGIALRKNVPGTFSVTPFPAQSARNVLIDRTYSRGETSEPDRCFLLNYLRPLTGTRQHIGRAVAAFVKIGKKPRVIG